MGQARIDRRPSSRDVAKLAGVSTGTVSNFLNRPQSVSESTRKRIEDAIRHLGFVRNGSARQLRMGSGQTVGVVVLDLAGPFFTAVARGVEDRLGDHGYVLMLCSSDEQGAKERRHLSQLEEQGVRGVLITPSGTDLTAIEDVRRRGTRVILMDQASPHPDMCSVAVDDVKGGELAAGHLLSLGHRRVGMVNGTTKIKQCADRREGVRRAIRAAGLSMSDTLLEVTVSSLGANGGEEAVGRMLADPNPPTAVVCVNDLTALGSLRALHARGVKVPDDVAVVGYDDVEFASMLAPPLTTVRRPKYELGQRAADLLMEELNRGPAHLHQQVMFQPELVVRDSSSRPGDVGRDETMPISRSPV